MSDVKLARLSLKTKEIDFNGEGDADWLAQQLDKVLKSLAPPPAPKSP